jgi:hypothetical protein
MVATGVKNAVASVGWAQRQLFGELSCDDGRKTRGRMLKSRFQRILIAAVAKNLNCPWVWDQS